MLGRPSGQGISGNRSRERKKSTVSLRFQLPACGWSETDLRRREKRRVWLASSGGEGTFWRFVRWIVQRLVDSPFLHLPENEHSKEPWYFPRGWLARDFFFSSHSRLAERRYLFLLFFTTSQVLFFSPNFFWMINGTRGGTVNLEAPGLIINSVESADFCLKARKRSAPDDSGLLILFAAVESPRRPGIPVC